MTSISTLKKGDYFKRKTTAKVVYIKGHYDRSSKTYACQDTEDMNREIFLKGSTIVHTDFEY